MRHQQGNRKQLERRASLRPPVDEERETEWQFRSAWDDLLREHGAHSAPLTAAYRAAWVVIDYWKQRALTAEIHDQGTA